MKDKIIIAVLGITFGLSVTNMWIMGNHVHRIALLEVGAENRKEWDANQRSVDFEGFKKLYIAVNDIEARINKYGIPDDVSVKELIDHSLGRDLGKPSVMEVDKLYPLQVPIAEKLLIIGTNNTTAIQQNISAIHALNKATKHIHERVSSLEITKDQTLGIIRELQLEQEKKANGTE